MEIPVPVIVPIELFSLQGRQLLLDPAEADEMGDDGPGAMARGRRKGIQEGLELGGKQGCGDPVDQTPKEAAEDNEGQKETAGAGNYGAQEESDLLRERIVLLDDARGERR
jgi:hypothetical protein